MHTTLVALLMTLVLSTTAFMCGRGSCNADNCLRAVRASSAKPGLASASADCLSLLQHTVTPDPTRITVTSTVAVTANPQTNIVSQIVAVFPTLAVTSTVLTTITTIADEVTQLQPATIIIPTTVVVPTTITLAGDPEKRDARLEARVSSPGYGNGFSSSPAATTQSTSTLSTTSAPVPEYGVQTNSARATQNTPSPKTTTSPTLVTSTTLASNDVPAYASACSGTVRYSSACSCVGATARTITASRATQTVTTTVTTTANPTVFITQEATVTSFQTLIQPQLYPATLEIIQTTTIPSLLTVYTTATVVTAVTAGPPPLPPPC